MINKEEYIAEKYIYSIIFGGTKGEYKDQVWITSMNILSSIRTVLKELTKYNYLSMDTKERLYNILSASRDIKTDDYEQRIELINDIVRQINSQKEDNSDEFYYNEMQKRLGQVYYIDDNIISDIDDSIVFDFILLYLHNLDSDSFKDFIDDFVEVPEKYLQSFNAIMFEDPFLLEDEKFVTNLHTVLSEIEKDRDFRKIKPLNKKIKTLVKKLGNS